MKRKIVYSGLMVLGLSIILMAFSSGPVFQATKEWKIPSKYVKMKNPSTPNAADARVGKTLYAKHCKSCHGTKGAGDGTKAKELKTKVIGNFTKGFGKQASDGEIYYKSFFGRDEMPSFEKKIKDNEDRWILVNYIKGLKK